MENDIIQLAKMINLSGEQIDSSVFAEYEARIIAFNSSDMCDCDCDCDCEHCG